MDPIQAILNASNALNSGILSLQSANVASVAADAAAASANAAASVAKSGLASASSEMLALQAPPMLGNCDRTFLEGHDGNGSQFAKGPMAEDLGKNLFEGGAYNAADAQAYVRSLRGQIDHDACSLVTNPELADLSFCYKVQMEG